MNNFRDNLEDYIAFLFKDEFYYIPFKEYVKYYKEDLKILSRQHLQKNPSSFYSDIRSIYFYYESRRQSDIKERDEILKSIERKYPESLV